jgi:hypothetical protein
MVSSSVSVYGSIVRCAGSAGIRPLADPAPDNYGSANEPSGNADPPAASSDEAFESLM